MDTSGLFDAISCKWIFSIARTCWVLKWNWKPKICPEESSWTVYT